MRIEVSEPQYLNEENSNNPLIISNDRHYFSIKQNAEIPSIPSLEAKKITDNYPPLEYLK